MTPYSPEHGILADGIWFVVMYGLKVLTFAGAEGWVTGRCENAARVTGAPPSTAHPAPQRLASIRPGLNPEARLLTLAEH